MPIAFLPDRAIIRVSGPDARHFLHNVVTCAVEDLAPGGARFGALLLPQGKIVSDFLLYAPQDEPDLFLLDAPRAMAEDLLKRLSLYRLRAKVELALDPDLAVGARWHAPGEADAGETAPGAQVYPDPRLPALGDRLVLTRAAAAALGDEVDAARDAYDAHRITLGIPQGGADFIYGDAFPHEVDMDQLGGVDFKKGCYVGQEVVSRMQHRGTARTRVVLAGFENAPEPGSEIRAGEKTIGRIGSATGGTGIALVRLDRAGDARAAGLPLVASGVEITLRRPDWALFDMAGAQ